MKIEVGKWYLRRDGTPVKILRVGKELLFPYKDDLGESYTETGKYTTISAKDHAKDLVKEWIPDEGSYLVKNAPEVGTEVKRVVAPHKHAEVIKAWADGETIEYKGPEMSEWKTILPPGQSMTVWRDDVEYRVKPKEVPPQEVIGVVIKHVDLYGQVTYEIANCVSESIAQAILSGNTAVGQINVTFNPVTREASEATWTPKE